MKRTIVNEWDTEYFDTKVVGQMTAVAIPVDISIEGRHRILDLSETEAILRNAEVVAQQECFCRNKLGNCDGPTDGCISMNDEARDMMSKGEAVEITVDEALEALRRSSKAGLVHMAYTFTDDDSVTVICSCCSCCCHTLSASSRFGYPDLMFASEHIAEQDDDRCVDCGLCVERCHFDAREMVDGALVYDAEKCYGCGLCLVCPEGAIGLVKRES